MADRRPQRNSSGKRQAQKTPRPRKKPANLKKAAAKKGQAKRGQPGLAGKKAGESDRNRSAALKAKRGGLDLSADPDAEVRFVQPYNATKMYLCPGCNGQIPVGVGHMVAVPPAAPELRRHWHRGCWNNRQNPR